MKAIMVMFDSLNRHMLPGYGCDWIKAPNFERLQKQTVMFDECYVGSLPCMPARRELHTGRLNFLHRSWGPMEPFDDSMPEILKQNNIYSHLVSDHQHYWEDGGCTYHTRYNSWEISRGQEGDPWKAQVGTVDPQETPFTSFKLFSKMSGLNMFRQDQVNRSHIHTEADMPQAVTFQRGIEFIQENHEQNNWFLQIETFDPHEPFFASQRFQDLYPDDEYHGIEFDWPPYAPVVESDDVVTHGRKRYAALLSMCDHYLGKVLDLMDKHDMWKDTMLIVNTDHGYLLGEHGWWSKSVMPTYNEIAHIPFFIWDPRYKVAGEHRSALVQTIDIAPTILNFFDLPIPTSMQGKSLNGVIQSDEPVREYALFGYHGGHINITDGKNLYMRAPIAEDNAPLFEYTLMPTHMRSMFKVNELQDIQLSDGFDFTKGCRLMKIKGSDGFIKPYQYGDKMFDLQQDPLQKEEIFDTKTAQKLLAGMVQLMKDNDAPLEQYRRMGLQPEFLTDTSILESMKQANQLDHTSQIFRCTKPAVRQIQALMNFTPVEQRNSLEAQLKSYTDGLEDSILTSPLLKKFILNMTISDDEKAGLLYFTEMAGRTS
ncbi:MAG: sulfatase [Lachnospiraceae bacterium]